MTPAIHPPAYRRVDERGELVEVIATGRWEAVLCGHMHTGAVIGHHYHRVTRIYFFLITGRADVVTVDVASGTRNAVALTPGHGVFLEPGEAHAIRFHAESEFIMVKSHRFDPQQPDTYPHQIDIDIPCLPPSQEGIEGGLTTKGIHSQPSP